MTRPLWLVGPVAVGLTLVLSAAMPPTSRGAAGEAKGTIAHKGKAVALTHCYLVTGPDAVDPKKTVRRVVLSAKDIGAKVRACRTMSCADGEVTEGLVVDMDGGPRLNYWMAINDQRVQYSGTKPLAALTASVNEPKRLAGKLGFDDTPASGPKVDVEFDAALVKEFQAAR